MKKIVFIIALAFAFVGCEKDNNCGEMSYNSNYDVSSQFRYECCPNTYIYPVRQELELDGHPYFAEGWINLSIHTEVGVREVTAQYWETYKGVYLWIDGYWYQFETLKIEYLIGQTICLQ